MERHQQDLTQLAIIGNGFDLAHEYHTRYVDFVESIGNDFFRRYHHYINSYCPPRWIGIDLKNVPTN